MVKVCEEVKDKDEKDGAFTRKLDLTEFQNIVSMMYQSLEVIDKQIGCTGFVRLTAWTPPSNGSWKLSFAGHYNRVTKTASVSCILRDNAAVFKSAFAGTSYPANSLTIAHLTAFSRAIEFAKREGVDDVPFARTDMDQQLEMIWYDDPPKEIAQILAKDVIGRCLLPMSATEA